MKALFFVAAYLLSVACFGQTKLIAFRSHSGSNANFRTAVEHSLFDIGKSNFGIVSPSYNDIDTVILKSNRQIIILRQTYYSLVNGKPYRPVSIKDTLTHERAASIFRADNPDSLKARIHQMYQPYKLANTVFIGFDKKFKQKKS